VVAVVCLGKAWQFKKWPFKVRPVAHLPHARPPLRSWQAHRRPAARTPLPPTAPCLPPRLALAALQGAGSGDLVQTFSKVLGVYVHYSDEGVDATVRSWNVKLLGLNRGSRHRDATVAQEFWRLLDAHLQARGSTLAY
jgi:parafibromin